MPIGTMIPGLFRDLDELSRRHQAAQRMRPPQERLLADPVTRPEVELRLEQHTELVALECLAESPLGEQAGDCLGVHCLIEPFIPRTAAALRAVHRGVRVAQEARGTIRGRGG